MANTKSKFQIYIFCVIKITKQYQAKMKTSIISTLTNILKKANYLSMCNQLITIMAASTNKLAMTSSAQPFITVSEI